MLFSWVVPQERKWNVKKASVSKEENSTPYLSAGPHTAVLNYKTILLPLKAVLSCKVPKNTERYTCFEVAKWNSSYIPD
jgi:hypothetical protein